MHRFFVPPQWIEGEEARLEGPQARQLGRVLRARRGDHLVLLDDQGWEYLVEVTAISESSVQTRVVERRPAPPEPGLSIILCQGLLKGKRFDWVLQKGTEMGIAVFMPLLCQRCVALPSKGGDNSRWASIIREASEQCGRGRLPRLAPPRTFQEACDQAPVPSLLLWEGGGVLRLREWLRKAPPNGQGQVGLFVGPEGGFSSQEVSYAERCGLLPVSLGPRILRGETAGLVAAVLLLYEGGDLG